MAQRTLDQRQIVINNLAIRRAAEELRVSEDYEQVCRVLTAAFDSNDFDAFELTVKLLPHEVASLPRLPLASHGELQFRWTKAGTPILPGPAASWTLSLEVITTSNRRRGSFTLHRLYTPRTLQLDVNLLTSEFPMVLADALDRVIGQAVALAPRADEDEGLVEAQAG